MSAAVVPGGFWRLPPAVVIVAALIVGGCGGGKAAKPPKDKYAGLTAVQIYEIASRQLEKKQHGKARETLQKALGRPDVPADLIPKIHLALADSYFHDGGILNLAEALSRYTNFLTFYPKHDRADYAQYQLGICYMRQTLSPDRDQAQTKKALDHLMKVGASYPNSEYVTPAYEKANEARELLAEHDFRIGYFYFRGRAWEGAAGRFKEILEDYPHFSRKPRLLLLLGRSLIALERQDEGRIYLQKLLNEFPKSAPAAEARALLQSASPGTAQAAQ